MLIVLGGLPGTGKSTIARALAQRHRAAWLRIDSIEQAIRDAGLPRSASPATPSRRRSPRRISASA